MLRRLSGALLALIAAFALAQDADAKPGSIVFPGGQESTFELRGSNGYVLEVISAGRETEVTARHGVGIFATYTVRSHKHGKRGFEAKLPGIGRIAVDFRPTGRSRKVPIVFPDCTGRPSRRQAGVFVGTINFHGERGYTEVTAARAKGDVLRSYPETCPVKKGGGGGKGGEEPIEALLTAAARKQGLFFIAGLVELGGEKFASYMAGQISGNGRMGIMRGVLAVGSPESFSAEHTGRSASARVEPPSPFSGAADFAIETDGTVNWTGDLSVTFPGTDPIRITGKRFVTRLCVGRKCAGDAASSAAPTPRLWPR